MDGMIHLPTTETMTGGWTIKRTSLLLLSKLTLCAGITLPIHPEAEQANGSSEIDDISLLDYEDDLGTDYGSVGHGADQMSDTSGDWDRCSNTGNVPESEVFPVETR